MNSLPEMVLHQYGRAHKMRMPAGERAILGRLDLVVGNSTNISHFTQHTNKGAFPMSKIPYQFLPVPQHLINSGLLDDLKTWKLFRYLLWRTRTEGHTVYMFGREVYLEPFEFIFGRESVAKATQLSGQEVYDRMVNFGRSKLISRVDSKRHTKYTVYRWMTENFDENRTQQNTQQNTQQKAAPQTHLRHSKATAEDAQIREREKRIEKEPSSAAQAPQVVMTKELITEGLIGLGIPKEESDKLFKTWGTPIVFLAYQHITADGYVIETTPIQALKFCCKSKPWEWNSNKPTPESHYQKFIKHFPDGSIHNGYTCQVNSKGFTFYAGLASDGAKFDDPRYLTQLSRVLKRFGIEHPTQIEIKNIKEA